MKKAAQAPMNLQTLRPQNNERKIKAYYFFLKDWQSPNWLRHRRSITALCIWNVMRLYLAANHLAVAVKENETCVTKVSKVNRTDACLNDIINAFPETENLPFTNTMEIHIGTEDSDAHTNRELFIRLKWIGSLLQLRLQPITMNCTHEMLHKIGQFCIHSLRSANEYRSKTLNEWLAYVLQQTSPKSVIKGKKRFRKSKTLIDCIETTCKRFPDKTAVSKGDQKMTYRELQQISDRIAGGLQCRGFRPSSVIGVLMEQSPDYVAVILGILKAQCICMPMDVRYPEERISEMMRCGNAPAIIVDEKCAGAWDKDAITCHELTESSELAINTVSHVDDDLFLYFTSGSTGAPKKVLLKNDGILNSICTKIHEMKICSDDKLSYVLSSGFVSSLWCCLGPAVVGAELVYTDTPYDVYSFFMHCRDRHVTIVEITPSFLKTFLNIERLNAKPLDLQKMKWLVSTGEEIASGAAASFYALHGNRRPYILNAYGMTECSDDVLHHPVKPGQIERIIPLGRPALRTSIYILDEQHRLVPQGVPGEIAVFGPGVAESCVPSDMHGKIYLTGDQGIILNGLVYYLGRKDENVKINGFKMRTADISDCALTQGGVKEAYTVWKPQGDKSEALLFCVTEEYLSEESIRKHLQERLPWYMLPAKIIKIPEIPLLWNGKIDREKLLEQCKVSSAPAADNIFDRLWYETMGTDAIAVCENIQLPGGCSLHLALLIAKINEHYNQNYSLFDLIENKNGQTLKEIIQNNLIALLNKGS